MAASPPEGVPDAKSRLAHRRGSYCVHASTSKALLVDAAQEILQVGNMAMPAKGHQRFATCGRKFNVTHKYHSTGTMDDSWLVEDS
jgi:hypothetical protein